MRSDDLTLHEQLMLLMLRDDTGTMESHTNLYQLALGGAVLAQLMLAESISIDDDKKRLVRLVSPQPPRDPILAECLDLVANRERPRSAADWVSHFGLVKRLRHRIAEGLCRRGILKDSEDKVLFFFTRAVYPTINPKPEHRLVERLREAVLGSSRELEPDIVLLIALAHATGLLRVHFDRRELKERKTRIESLARGAAVARSTADAVGAAQQAIQAAIMSAVITSSVIHSS